MSVTVPFENGAVHDPVPEYVPLIVVGDVAGDTVNGPVSVTVHSGATETPPAGTDNVHEPDVPASEIVTVPVRTTVPWGVRVIA